MVSTKGRYALRVMLDLAQQEDNEKYVPLEEIANRQCISKKYLEIILKVLVQNKLLQGLRGKHGGYRLMRKPEECTVLEILQLTEGSMAVVACLQDGALPCEREHQCNTLPMWRRFDVLVRDFFGNITLADLCKEVEVKE